MEKARTVVAQAPPPAAPTLSAPAVRVPDSTSRRQQETAAGASMDQARLSRAAIAIREARDPRADKRAEFRSTVSLLEAPAVAMVPDVCYRLREVGASADVPTLMRRERSQGDTIQLEPLSESRRERAWIVLRDTLGHGVLTPKPGALGRQIVASVVPCPAP